MGLLDVSNLTKRFGGLTAVNDLTFGVEEGEFLGLIGPNGAGKSTIFNLITSYLTPTRGIVLFKNKKITRLSTHKIAAVGVVRTFQHNNLFLDMSIYENVMISQHLLGAAGSFGFFLNSAKARRDEKQFHETAMELLGFTGLMPFKDELAKNLSHGHQRILGMAVALAVKPKLLLLDEPFTGMHPKETETAMEMVSAMRKRGLTIILVEHNMKAVMGICERIVVINFGKKIAEGTPEKIRQNHAVIEAYLGKEELV